MTRYDYHKPETIEEALSLMACLEGAKYIAGGTDVMVLIKQKKLMPKHLISIRNIRDLGSIDTGNGLKLGAAATHNHIDGNDVIRRWYTALTDATGHLGSRQIRNVATIGGNICNAAPSADTACPLLVFDATVSIIGPWGRRTIALDDFFKGPGSTALREGELVQAFHIPGFGENTGSAYIKHTRRQAMDLPIIGLAARMTIGTDKHGGLSRCKAILSGAGSTSAILAGIEGEGWRCEDARIAMSVVAPRPIRAKKAEAALKGKVISGKLLQEGGELAASEASPRDSIRGEAWYRTDMIKVLLKRAIVRSIERVVRPDDGPDRARTQ